MLNPPPPPTLRFMFVTTWPDADGQRDRWTPSEREEISKALKEAGGVEVRENLDDPIQNEHPNHIYCLLKGTAFSSTWGPSQVYYTANQDGANLLKVRVGSSTQDFVGQIVGHFKSSQDPQPEARNGGGEGGNGRRQKPYSDYPYV